MSICMNQSYTNLNIRSEVIHMAAKKKKAGKKKK